MENTFLLLLLLFRLLFVFSSFLALSHSFSCAIRAFDVNVNKCEMHSEKTHIIETNLMLIQQRVWFFVHFVISKIKLNPHTEFQCLLKTLRFNNVRRSFLAHFLHTSTHPAILRFSFYRKFRIFHSMPNRFRCKFRSPKQFNWQQMLHNVFDFFHLRFVLSSIRCCCFVFVLVFRLGHKSL